MTPETLQEQENPSRCDHRGDRTDPAATAATAAGTERQTGRDGKPAVRCPFVSNAASDPALSDESQMVATTKIRQPVSLGTISGRFLFVNGIAGIRYQRARSASPFAVDPGFSARSQDRMAHIVHAISLFRERPLVALGRAPGEPDTPDPEGAQRDLVLEGAATVLCDLADEHDRLDPALASRLFSSRYQTRVIALARSARVATTALGERRVEQMAHVWLAPLSSRRGAIHRLLDGMFQERGSSLRVAAMTPHNQDALRRHHWARNFASLREAADRLIAVAREPSLRRAALALGVPPATFHNWYANIVRLELPLLAEARTLGNVEGHR
jgi:hypothetical protein